MKPRLSASGAGSEPPRGTARPRAGPAERPRPRSNDLGLELYRQQTLLQVMASRLRETAGGLDGGFPVTPDRLARALDVHERFLLGVHHVDDERVLTALEGRADVPVDTLRRQNREDAERAQEFEETLRRAVRKGSRPTGAEARRLANLLRDEADRIDRHQAREVEGLDDRLEEWLPADRRAELLREIRAFDASRVDAEVALVSWASQIHPSSD